MINTLISAGIADPVLMLFHKQNTTWHVYREIGIPALFRFNIMRGNKNFIEGCVLAK
jgi:hypothetical protein